MTQHRLDLAILPRQRVRLIRQTEMAECGLACLAMVAGYHGLKTDLASLRRRFTPSARGLGLESLMEYADRLDLTTHAVKVELDDIGALSLPAILHWDLNHYVVLAAVSGRRMLIHDPARGSGWQTREQLSRHFTGIALEMAPSASFEPSDARQRLALFHLWSRVRGLGRALSQATLLSFVIQAFALATPYYIQLAVDRALMDPDLGIMTVLALGFGLLALLNGVALLLRSSVLLSVGASFGYGLSSNLARRLFRLPVDWFGRRHVGDAISRFQSVVPVRKLLAEDAPAALVDGVLAVFTLLMMWAYSGTLALIALAAVAVYALICVALFKPQWKAEEGELAAIGREQTVLIESIRGIRAVRLSGREFLRHALWQSSMTDATNGMIRSQRLTNWQTAAQLTLFAIENVVSIWIGIALVADQQFSVGMLFAFLAYKAQFILATSSLTAKFYNFKMLGLHLERLSDIALSAEDVSFQAEPPRKQQLEGRIELRGVTFRYSNDDPLVLKGVDLCVEPGESIAITGPSGGGKSTLVQLLLGLAEPTSGEVLIDGLPLRSFGYKAYHQQIAAVLQDDTLFSGSIRENIAMFEERPDHERVREAAIAAAIDRDISRLPMGYETQIGESGSTLSGGQRQRVLLARAIYRQPRLLVMDEGTSHLDQACERDVNAAVARLGITRIVVAHRQETIRSAERLFVLDDGALTQSTEQLLD